MLVEGQLVEVKISSHTFKHYNDLGYNVHKNDIIFVPPEHLTNGSHALVSVVCDICGRVVQIKYKAYLKHHTYDLDCCKKCIDVKRDLVINEKYGVKNIAQLDWVQEKRMMTNLQKYGVHNPMENENIKKKAKNTCIEKYGVECPLQDRKVQDKSKKTCLEKYGYEKPTQSEIIKNRVKQTNINRYGVENPMQNPAIREKAMNTLACNGNVRTSKQQLELYNMIKNKYPQAIINFPYSHCSLDIYLCVNDVKIDIEYLGWYWHQDSWKDTKRGKYLQSCGFKVLYVKSGYLLPAEEELFDVIDKLVTTEYHFKEIILSDWKDSKEVNPHVDENIA